ncbi:cryptochrome/photolyase family protein [Candidatus Bodocaedibacter vickermanii]|uniref:Deoxyribodipyrimidine photo-lyase n=1 Tax=Candidatus Bodocaedibacter vickermanii TaxID=2741701 RepID=A0A7L9RTH4_9PROT|nr:Deoxyribodipyrimidine photo-lyase [Candidatus Paracaedibacteraceae bacterium 'Lake Konstanz']
MSLKTIVWFRQDLRIHDNPALEYAAARGTIIPVYILDDDAPGQWKLGGASRWWLHHSLQSLSNSLESKGHRLHIFAGDPQQILSDLQHQTQSDTIVWNRCYEPFSIARDKAIKESMTSAGINVKSFNASLLFEPWTIKNLQGNFFKVFTPFWKHCLQQSVDPITLSGNSLDSAIPFLETLETSVQLDDFKLLPSNPNWATGFDWSPGEFTALHKLNEFFETAVMSYKEQRDYMDKSATSMLSPHLHFGEISPRLIYHRCQELMALGQGDLSGVQHFLSELGWREFSYHLLYHFPVLPTEPFRSEFNQFEWGNNPDDLRKWQQGKTGFPIIDAAMQELWQTGYMHNRARMIVASFLTKNLLIHWRHGAEWFWDTLVDADLASNSASWQWVAGCGVDAAPYFRIFNPITQGEKFDPDGIYVKRWIPELRDLDVKYIHQPWTAPLSVLKDAGVRLGHTYPEPMVDLKATRNRALQAYAGIRE